MRVLLTAVGSRGDVQPFVALAIGLKDAGHTVAICTCPKFREFVVGHGIEFLHLDDGLLRLLESDLGRKLFQNLTGLLGLLKTIPSVIKQIGPIQKRMVDDCWAAVESFKPDAIMQVTREESYRNAARSIQSSLVRERGVERSIEMIEEIATR